MPEQMRAEIAKVREDTRKALQRDAYFWIVMIATVLLGSGGSMAVSVYLTQRSEQKLCAMVITSDDNYRTQPPLTELGKRQAANFNKLRTELGCSANEGK